MWRSKDSFQDGFSSFCHVGPGIVPMSCGFGAKCLYQLSCLPDPFEVPVFASKVIKQPFKSFTKQKTV